MTTIQGQLQQTISGKTVVNFYDLDTWQKAHGLALKIYQITKDFPSDERYGMTNQLRRASSSITANIAEGFSRYHFKDKIRFYHQARGSVSEVQSFLLLARDLQYINHVSCDNLMTEAHEVARLINGMIRSIGRQ